MPNRRTTRAQAKAKAKTKAQAKAKTKAQAKAATQPEPEIEPENEPDDFMFQRLMEFAETGANVEDVEDLPWPLFDYPVPCGHPYPGAFTREGEQAYFGSAPKARAKAKSSARAGLCDLPGCTKDAGAQTCCQRRVCAQCAFQLVQVCICHPDVRYRMRCPFCRGGLNLEVSEAKILMARFCPSHAKVMKNHCGDGDVVVAHKACDTGCYECNESELVAHQL